MKKVVLILFLLLPKIGYSQVLLASWDLTTNPNRQTGDPFPIGNRSLSSHVFTWSVQQGTLTSCTVNFQTSPDNTPTSTWTTQGTGDCSTSGTSGFINFAANWIRVTASPWTPAIMPTRVTVNWAGYVIPPTNLATYSPGNVTNFNNVRFCNNYSGATADIKIGNCIADLPSTGGAADTRGILGAQSWNSDPFIGVTKPVDLICGAATYTVAANTTMAANVHLSANQGCIFSPNTGITLTINGSMDGSSASQHFSGVGTVVINRSHNKVVPAIWSPNTIVPETGYASQPLATIESSNQNVAQLDPAGFSGQPNLSTFSAVTQYNGTYLGGGASSGYFDSNFNQAGTMAGGNQAVSGFCRQLGAGATGECDGGSFSGLMVTGTAGQIAGVVGISFQSGGAITTTAGIPGQMIGGLFGVSQTGGTNAGPMSAILVSATTFSGGTNAGVYGVNIHDQGAANFGLRIGTTGTNAGVLFSGGTIWIASAGNEHPADHAVFIAGPAAANENFSILGTGIVNNYNGINKGVNENGLPFTAKSVEVDGLIANNGPGVIYATAPAGRYRMCAGVLIQTQATTSSTIPTVNFIYTDRTTAATATQVIVPAISGVAANPTAGTAVGGCGIADIQNSTNIQYSTTGYASVGVQSMVYKYYVILEAL